MKKFMMIALVATGFIMIATPESNAGVSIGIGLGLPVGSCGYPAYYQYGYYPYGAAYYPPVIYYSSVYGPYYWWHGRRIFVRHRHFR